MDIMLKISRWLLDDYPEGNGDPEPDLVEFKQITRQVNELVQPRLPRITIFRMRRKYQKFRAREEYDSLTIIRILASVFVDGY